MIRIRGLCKSFPRAGGGEQKVLDGLNLEIRSGEILGLIGRSGEGKTTLARILTGLESADRGSIRVRGMERIRRSRRKWSGPPENLQPGNLQMIFQDPYASLSPRMRIYDIVAEPLRIQKRFQKDKGRIPEILEQVGLFPADHSRFSFELSGGERQRVALARALILKPRFLAADEILSMLDSTRKADMLDLLRNLRDENGLTLLFITHDIGSAAYLCDRIAVMDSGRIVETAPADRLIEKPQSEITRKFIDAIPAF